MKFGPVAPSDALGATAVHSIRQGELVLKKGTLIGPPEVAALKAASVKEIVVSRLEPGDVSEDQAAAEIAKAVAGEGVRTDRAFTGRCNLFAETAGILVVEKDTIDRGGRRQSQTGYSHRALQGAQAGHRFDFAARPVAESRRKDA